MIEDFLAHELTWITEENIAVTIVLFFRNIRDRNPLNDSIAPQFTSRASCNLISYNSHQVAEHNDLGKRKSRKKKLSVW